MTDEERVFTPGEPLRYRLDEDDLAWAHLDRMTLMSVSMADVIGTRVTIGEADARQRQAIERGVKALFNGDYEGFAKAAVALGARAQEEYEAASGDRAEHPLDALTLRLGAFITIARSAYVTAEKVDEMRAAADAIRARDYRN